MQISFAPNFHLEFELSKLQLKCWFFVVVRFRKMKIFCFWVLHNHFSSQIFKISSSTNFCATAIRRIYEKTKQKWRWLRKKLVHEYCIIIFYYNEALTVSFTRYIKRTQFSARCSVPFCASLGSSVRKKKNLAKCSKSPWFLLSWACRRFLPFRLKEAVSRKLIFLSFFLNLKLCKRILT